MLCGMERWRGSAPRAVCLLLATAIGWAVPADPSWKESAGQARKLQQSGKYAEAEALLLRKLQDARASHSEDSGVPILLNNLASVCQDLGRTVEAEGYYRQAIAWLERANAGAALITPLHNLASLYSESGRFALAARLEKRALEMSGGSSSQTETDRAALVHGLAFALDGQGRFSEAEPLYQQAIAAWTDAKGHERDLADALTNLGYSCTKRKRPEEGVTHLLQAIRILESGLGPNHPALVKPLNNLAFAYLAARQPGSAEPLIERALAIAAVIYGPQHEIYGVTLGNYASVLRQLGRKEEAKDARERASAIAARSKRPPGQTIDVSEVAGYKVSKMNPAR